MIVDFVKVVILGRCGSGRSFRAFHGGLVTEGFALGSYNTGRWALGGGYLGFDR